MTKRPNLSQISSPVFTVSQLNQAYTKIDEAFDNTLSRDGSTPNTMLADLDMNSNDILNAGVLYGTTVNVDEAYIGGKLFTGTLTWRSGWLTATSYQENDLVKINGNVYVCLDGHTSGVFATDLSSSKWELFIENQEGSEGPQGDPGAAGQGVPVGGTTGQVLAKIDGTDYNTEWVDQSGDTSITDGDKGDITVSSTGSVWTIDNGAVSLAKMANMATASLLGRSTAGTGTPEVLSASTARSLLGLTESIIIAVSDELTALVAGTGKVTFRMPYAFTLTGIRASLTTAQTSGSIFTVDVNEGGASILSTKITIDNTEKTSTTAATPAVISDTSLADDAEITIDIDQVGNGTATGLKVTLIGHR